MTARQTSSESSRAAPTRFSSEWRDMATDSGADDELVAALRSSAWRTVTQAITASTHLIRTAPPGAAQTKNLIHALSSLATHPKWEVRRSIALAGTEISSESFDAALRTLSRDANARVRDAAVSAIARRRDRRSASVLGQERDARVVSLLDDVETRYGVTARQATKRAAEEIANMFARELYHEVAKILTPLAMSVTRVRSATETVAPAVAAEMVRIEADVRHVQAVVEAMRSYAYVPRLVFTQERMADVVATAASIARAKCDQAIPIVANVPDSVVAEVASSRFAQALENLISNAAESYNGLDPKPVIVRGESREGYVVLTVTDQGPGMSAAQIIEARQLFATTKSRGTGFGLPLAIKIVETEHLGRLTIDSEPGRGTTVEVIIPLSQSGQ